MLGCDLHLLFDVGLSLLGVESLLDEFGVLSLGGLRGSLLNSVGVLLDFLVYSLVEVLDGLDSSLNVWIKLNYLGKGVSPF